MLALTTTQPPRFFAAATAPIPTATIGLNGANISIGWGTAWGLASVLSAIASGYHGYKRHHENAGWTALWALGGAVFPIITPIVALAQGYAKPMRGGFGRRRRYYQYRTPLTRRRRERYYQYRTPLMRRYRRRGKAD